MRNLLERLKKWWNRLIIGEWLTLDESIERLSEHGLGAFNNTANVPAIIFFGVFDGDKVIVRAFRREDIDVKYIIGLGPELSKRAADFLEKIE